MFACIERVIEEFFRDVDILFLVSHCSSCVMFCCLFNVVSVAQECLDMRGKSSAYERTMLRFA